jgi:hypothetical protein
MGKNWEKEIRDLITTASFIFIYNPQMTPGIVREIKLIKESGCQGRAFYSSPENAQQVIKTGDIHRLTDSVVERARAMTSACHLKRGILPAPTFLWIKGKRRVNIESDTRQIMERLFELNKTNIAIGADDYLDMLFHLLSGSIVIEDFELLAIVLVLICGTFASIGEKHLPSQADFANRYALYANAFYASVKQTSQSLQPIDRGVRIFRQFKRLQRQNPDTKDLDSSPKHHSFSDKK